MVREEGGVLWGTLVEVIGTEDGWTACAACCAKDMGCLGREEDPEGCPGSLAMASLEERVAEKGIGIGRDGVG